MRLAPSPPLAHSNKRYASQCFDICNLGVGLGFLGLFVSSPLQGFWLDLLPLVLGGCGCSRPFLSHFGRSSRRSGH